MFYPGRRDGASKRGHCAPGPAGGRGGRHARRNARRAGERGISFLVAVPPNSSTIYQDDLPFWAQPRAEDRIRSLLDDLAAAGVKAVDLRPAIRAARSKAKSLPDHDAHWTARGACRPSTRSSRRTATLNGDLIPVVARTARGAQRRRHRQISASGRGERNEPSTLAFRRARTRTCRRLEARPCPQ